MIEILTGHPTSLQSRRNGLLLNVCIGRLAGRSLDCKSQGRGARSAVTRIRRRRTFRSEWLILRGKCSGCREPSRSSINRRAVGGRDLAGRLRTFRADLHRVSRSVFVTVLLGSESRRKAFSDSRRLTVFGVLFVILTSSSLSTSRVSLLCGPVGRDFGVWSAPGRSRSRLSGKFWLKRPAMGFGDVTLMPSSARLLGRPALCSRFSWRLQLPRSFCWRS